MTPKSLQYHFTRIFFTFSFVLNDLFHIFSNNNKTTISKNNIASLRHLFLHQNSSLGTFLSITQWAELVYSGTALVEPLSALGAPNPAGLLFYTSSWVLLEAEGADDDVVEGQLLKGRPDALSHLQNLLLLLLVEGTPPVAPHLLRHPILVGDAHLRVLE